MLVGFGQGPAVGDEVGSGRSASGWCPGCERRERECLFALGVQGGGDCGVEVVDRVKGRGCAVAVAVGEDRRAGLEQRLVDRRADGVYTEGFFVSAVIAAPAEVAGVAESASTSFSAAPGCSDSTRPRAALTRSRN